MVISVVDCRVGTLVWVQRKNGSWWPGRVVEPNDLSPSHLMHRRAGAPVKLLGREDASVDWYNLEKSKRIKAFRCGEFDDCIERAESSQANFSKKIVKYAHREDAILHALELEKQEVQKKRKAPGEEQARNICQAKRSRRVYLPAGSNNCWKRTDFHPEPLQVSFSTFEMHEYSLQSGSAEDDTSSRSMESDSSESDSQGADRLEKETQLSAEFRLQKCELKGKENICHPTKRHGDVIAVKSCIKLKNGIQQNGEPLTSSAALDGHRRNEFDTKILDNSVWIANTLSLPAPRSSYLEDPGSQCFDPVYIGFHNRMETALIDVELTVQASYQGEHVPMVSLMSRSNGKAIIGHPIDIEASDDNSSEILLARKHEIGHKLFDNDGGTMLQRAWRTSRRTPVCYVSQPHPPPSLKDDKNVEAYPKPGLLSLKARAKSLPPTQVFLRKPPKKPRLSNQKTRTLSAFDTEQKHNGNDGDLLPISQGCMIDGLFKAKDSPPTRVTCVPVKVIFSKLLAAVGGVQS